MSIEEIRYLFTNHTYIEKTTRVRYFFLKNQLYVTSKSPYEGEFDIIEEDGKFYLRMNPLLDYNYDLEIVIGNNSNKSKIITLKERNNLGLIPFAELMED